MGLKLYQISSTLKNHPDCGAVLKESSLRNEVYSFFEMNAGDEKRIRELNPEFVAGKGYTNKNIMETDYIFSFSALLFSKKFVESIGNVLKEEMRFFPCKIICRDSRDICLEWYAAKITHYFPFVDKGLSTYRTLTNGEKALKSIKYKKDIDEKFYVARDTEHDSIFAVSELFKGLCEENGLMIGFDQPFFFK